MTPPTADELMIHDCPKDARNCPICVENFRKIIDTLNAVNEKLRKALEFYADNKGWDQEEVSDGTNTGTTWRPRFSLRNDHGNIARAALAAEEEGK